MTDEASDAGGVTEQDRGRRLRIDVWTDLVCPWCYVGQARLDQAIAAEGVDVDLVVHSFELDPSTPAAGEAAPSNLDHLVRAKGMPREQVVAMEEQIRDLAEEIGVPYVTERPMAGTRSLHRVVQTVARSVGPDAASTLFSRLQGGYFAGESDPFDAEVLVAAAVAAGGAEADVRRAVAADVPEAEAWVDADIERARSLGVQGVPFMVFDNRVAAPGAMDVDTYRRALRRLADGEEVA